MAKRELTERARVEALFLEKPFLNSFTKPESIINARVERAGADLLTEHNVIQTINEEGFDGYIQVQHFITRILLLNRNGEILFELGKRTHFNPNWKARKWWQVMLGIGQKSATITIEGKETIRYRLSDLPRETDIIYALKLTETLDKNTMRTGKYYLRLYRASSGKNLLESIEADIAEAQTELREQLAN